MPGGIHKTKLNGARTAFALLALIVFVAVGAISWNNLRGSAVSGPKILPFPAALADYYQLDDVAGHVHRASAERRYDWPEHPDGHIIARTNNLGFREDEPTTMRKPAGIVRILVAGDSHMDGVVHNHESFANRLEARLNEGGRYRARFEVLNGGVGHYGPHNYLGLLERSLPLGIDAYLIVLYEGNDFIDTIRAEVMADRFEVPERPGDYVSRLEHARSISLGAFSQAVNQLYFFKVFPQLRSKAIEFTASQLSSARALCDANGIELWVVTLPAKLDLERAALGDTLDRLTPVLELTPHDLSLNRMMTDQLRAQLEVVGIRVLPGASLLRGQDESLYWLADHHLNVAGHDALAFAVLDRLDTLWDSASTSATAPDAERRTTSD